MWTLMITVHGNGTKTTFRHYHIQDIARLLGHYLSFFCRCIFVEGNFTNKLGVFASSISWKLPFRTQTHTQRRHVDTCSKCLLFDSKLMRIVDQVYVNCMCGQCLSLLINQIYKSICLKLKHNKISTDFKSPYSTYLHVEAYKKGQYPHRLLCGKLTKNTLFLNRKYINTILLHASFSSHPCWKTQASKQELP